MTLKDMRSWFEKLMESNRQAKVDKRAEERHLEHCDQQQDTFLRVANSEFDRTVRKLRGEDK